MSSFTDPGVVANFFPHHSPERELNEKLCRRCKNRLRIGKENRKYCSPCLNGVKIIKYIEKSVDAKSESPYQLRIRALDALCND